MNDDLTIIDDPDPKPLIGADAVQALTDALAGRPTGYRRKRDRAAANMPRRNTPKAERKTPAVTAVTTPVTAEQLGHAPRPRKAKQ